MSKRPRRRKVKRSSRSHGRQRRQQLTKEVRELYPAASDTGDDDWHAALEPSPAPRRPGGKIRPIAPPPAAPLEPPAGSNTSDSAGDPRLALRYGQVVAVASGACTVDSDGESLDCVLPSELARDQRSAVAVGDRAVFTAHGGGAHRLARILPRRTTLSRPDPLNPRLERVIAANIDVAVHVASVVDPPLKPALIDRYLIAIDRGGAEAIICVNKVDLLESDTKRRRELEPLDAYRPLVPVILATSAVTGEGLGELADALAGKTAVVVGHSGVGKSSLLNALDPILDTATAETSGGKGRHTTTRSSLYRLAGGARVIDTPGIRELGLWRLTSDQVRAYFPDFEAAAAACRFNDCSHSHEPDCGVRAAAEAGDLDRGRFETYLRILSSVESES